MITLYVLLMTTIISRHYYLQPLTIVTYHNNNYYYNRHFQLGLTFGLFKKLEESVEVSLL